LREDHGEAPRIVSAADVFRLLRDEFAPQRQETTVALYLDTKMRLVARETLFVGSLNQSLVHPREVFRFAVKHSAHQLILAHNHPSGDPTPSPQDLDVTSRFREIGDLLGIRLADHVVVAGDRYVSIVELLRDRNR
jgi:DNA repair protein RadC